MDETGHRPTRVAGAVIREIQAGLGTMVLPWLGRRPLPKPVPLPGRRPVILVHGFMGHPEILRPIAVHLLANGWPRVERIGYSSFRTEFDEILDRIDAVVAGIDGPVDLVGHSLGALACRAWLKTRGGAARCERFVSLAAPFHGTALYRLVPGPLRRVLDPRGTWVHRLDDGPEPVLTVVIRARYDTNIVPRDSATIGKAGVRQVIIDGTSHNGMLWSRRVARAVAKALSDPLDG